MSYIDQITVGSTTYDIQDSNAQRKAMIGSGAPTTSTAGAVGDYYIDTSATAAPYLYMCVDATGGTYTWECIDGKVNKNGDTMTGALNINDPDLTSGDSETVWGEARVNFCDHNGTQFGYFQAYTQNGRNGIQFTAVRDVGGIVYTHGFLLGIDDSGNRRVYFHDANAWLTALGLTTTSTSTVSDIISVTSPQLP